MSLPKTIFVTYQFELSPSFSAETGYGNSTPIHCNYIQKIETDDFSGKNVSFFFPDSTKLPFLKDATGMTSGEGWVAYKLNALIQIVDGVSSGSTTIEADPAQWRIFDVTNQITGHVAGKAIDKDNLAQSIFTITQAQYSTGTTYDLTYLLYPTNVALDDDKLAFGEEVFFFGNVKTDIKAIAFTTEIPIVLGLNEFNSTTNPTWDQLVPVQITEIGIYSSSGDLVGIGKLNYPLSKDSSTSRSLLFQIDF